MLYTGVSIVDYLNSSGQDSSYANRAKLATANNISNYTGSAAQNTQLLGILNKPASTSTLQTVTSSAGNINTFNPQTGMYSSGNAPVTPIVPATTSSTIRNDLKTAKDNNIPVTIPTTTSYEDYVSKIQPTISKPETPNYVDTYTKLRADQGTPALEDSIGQYDAQKADLLASLDKFKTNSMVGDPLGFAQGRISTEQQGIQDQIDFIDRQENIAINKLNTKNKFIENVMSLTKDDYTTANDNYNTEFNRNMSIQSSLSTENNQVRDDSRATLTTINNMISNSGKSYAELDATTKANINTLELQSGMPVGTFETFATSKPKANIISTSTGTDASGNDFVYFISKDPSTGELSTDKMYTGGVSKSADSSTTMTEAERKAFINTQIGSAGFKAASDDEKSAFIRSLGGNPYDYQPY